MLAQRASNTISTDISQGEFDHRTLEEAGPPMPLSFEPSVEGEDHQPSIMKMLMANISNSTKNLDTHESVHAVTTPTLDDSNVV